VRSDASGLNGSILECDRTRALTATAAALLAGAVLRLGTDGDLGGADDIGWLWLSTE
jgi:hypothetical protein